MTVREVQVGDTLSMRLGLYVYPLRITKTYMRRGSCMADVYPAHQGPINLGPLGGIVSRDVFAITRDGKTIYEREKP